MSAVFVPKKPNRFSEDPNQRVNQYFQWHLNCWRAYNENQLTPSVLQRHVADMLSCLNEELEICKNSDDNSYYQDLDIWRFNAEKLLAYCFVRAGALDEAFKIFEKVLHEMPENFHLYQDCIDVLCAQRKWEVAASLINTCPYDVLISEEKEGFEYLNTIFQKYPDISQIIDTRIIEIVSNGLNPN